MSRGLGASQRRVLDALISRRSKWDRPELWYTAESLELFPTRSDRSQKESLRRAIRTLAARGLIETRRTKPRPPGGPYYQETLLRLPLAVDEEVEARRVHAEWRHQRRAWLVLTWGRNLTEAEKTEKAHLRQWVEWYEAPMGYGVYSPFDLALAESLE